MEVRKIHHLLAELQVTMEGGEALVHPLHQPRIHTRRNIRAVERRFERGLVVPRVRVELVRLDLAVQRRPECPLVSPQRVEKHIHDLLPVGAIWHPAVQAEGRRVELHGLAVAERHRRIGKVRV